MKTRTVRGIVKKSKPSFRRRDIHKKARIKKSWRAPKGITNKLRLGFRGYGKAVNIGYGSPAAIRGVHFSGLMPINVYNPAMLESLDNKTQGIIVSKSVGQKKKLEIVSKAKELSLQVLNVKDVDAYLSKVKKAIEEEKKTKEEKAKTKEEKKKQAEKAAEKKAKEKKAELSDEEKRKAELKEKEKVLVTKE